MKIIFKDKKIRRMFKQVKDGKHSLEELEALVLENFQKYKSENERLKKAVVLAETKNSHKITPKGERVLVIEVKRISNPKLTYRPYTGELLLKIPENTHWEKVNTLQEFSKYIMRDLSEESPLTLRGNPHWSESDQKYRVCLRSNCKRFYEQFEF